MDISSEIYAKASEKYAACIAKSGKRSRLAMAVFRVCGIAFIAGALTVVFRMLTGIIICTAAAALYVLLFYLETGKEKAEQLALYHMICSRKAISALLEYSLNGCTDKAMDAFKEISENETDTKRAAVMNIYFSRLLSERGMYEEAFSLNTENKELFAEDPYFELVYNFEILKYHVSAKSRNSAAVSEAYGNISKIFSENTGLKDDFFSLCVAADTEIIYSYYREDYFGCVEYTDLRLSAENTPPFGLSEKSALIYRLTKAECLYYIGRYDEARTMCADISKQSEELSFINEKAAELDGLLN